MRESWRLNIDGLLMEGLPPPRARRSRQVRSPRQRVALRAMARELIKCVLIVTGRPRKLGARDLTDDASGETLADWRTARATGDRGNGHRAT